MSDTYLQEYRDIIDEVKRMEDIERKLRVEAHRYKTWASVLRQEAYEKLEEYEERQQEQEKQGDENVTKRTKGKDI